MARDDVVDQAVRLRFLCGKPVVALAVDVHLLLGLAAVLGDDTLQAVARLLDLVGHNLDIGLLRVAVARAAHGLVNHDLGVRQDKAFARRAAGQKGHAHRRRHAQADGGHVALHELHGVVDGKARRHAAARGVDVERDVLFRIGAFKMEHLRDDGVRHMVIDGLAEEDDAVV